MNVINHFVLIYFLLFKIVKIYFNKTKIFFHIKNRKLLNYYVLLFNYKLSL